jgi:ParB family chromosome partitioning protein
MQPIVVRSIADKQYEIVAGERRWRACQLAGLEKIPALVREIPDEAAIAMALIENIQRENLNAIEEAVALSRLQQEFGLTHEQIATAVGKSRTSVTNALRLLGLNPDVRTLLEARSIEMGHARALLGLSPERQTRAANQIISRGLNVRQAEALVRTLQSPSPPLSNGEAEAKSADIRQLERALSEKLGSPLTISHNAKGRGKLVITYTTLDELEGILAHIR